MPYRLGTVKELRNPLGGGHQRLLKITWGGKGGTPKDYMGLQGGIKLFQHYHIQSGKEKTDFKY